MEIVFPELENISAKLDKLMDMVADLLKGQLTGREWYDLKAACDLKGLNYNTVSSRRKLQPNFGKEDAKIAGRRRWRKETVLKWLETTDQDFVESLNDISLN